MEPRNPLTIYKLMALAGPDRNKGKLNKVQLVREAAEGRKEIVTLNVTKILKGESADVALKDGDIVYVPNNSMAIFTSQMMTSVMALGTAIAVYRLAYQ
jgi:protein involved in polysaccharide export with SLBB domain